MKSTLTVLGMASILFALGLSFASASDDEEFIDKGRRVTSGASRSHSTAPRTSTPSVRNVRTGGSAYARQHPDHPTGGYNYNLRIDQNTGRVTNNGSGVLNRMPNGYRPGVFNSPTYGDTAAWSAGQRRQTAAPGPASPQPATRSTVPSYTQNLAPLSSTNTIGQRRDPSTEPQFLNNSGALRPVPVQRQNPVRSTSAGQFAEPGPQAQLRPRRASGMSDFIRGAAHNHWVTAGVSTAEVVLGVNGQEWASRGLNTVFHTIQGATAENLSEGAEAIGGTAVNMVPVLGPASTALYHAAAGATAGTILQPVVTSRTPQDAAREIGAHNGPLCPGFRETTETYDFARQNGFIDGK
jgi:hypothetical protein